jgi:hypothetical protein
MEKCMQHLNLKEVLVFLDDLIVFSSTLEEHETRLIHVLERLKEYGLKLSPEKCRVSQNLCSLSRTDPEKMEALRCWQEP